MLILLAGSTGFLGSYLLKSFIESGYDVIGLKRSTSDIYRINNYLGKAIFYDIDIVQLSEIFNKHKIDVVINTVTDYGRYNKSIVSLLDTNLIFGLNLLEESINFNIKVFINSDTLLDKEINAYALSKSQLVDWMKLVSNNDIKVINIRIEHMYGLLDDDNKFIYWLIDKLKSNIDSIDLTSGIQKRDFIYISDIIKAYEIIILNIDKLSNYEEFELGNGSSIEVREFINCVYNELLKKYSIDTILNFGMLKYRDNENMNMIADITKLKQLGWIPTVSMADGIKKIINGENI